MRAREHTRVMLQWWRSAGITMADLAARRRDGTMVWHYEIPIESLPLGWARAENLRLAEIYIRPARNHAWPMVFLDDLPVEQASRVANKYDSLVVHTSAQGGCHLWLLSRDALNENQRRRAQQWLAQRVAADPASTSGEHLGRLAGFKNRKRGGVWVNVLVATRRDRRWNAQLLSSDGNTSRQQLPEPRLAAGAAADSSPSGQDWAWTCRILEAGCDPATAYLGLVQRARPRRGRDAERYARRTVTRAVAHVRPRRT